MTAENSRRKTLACEAGQSYHFFQSHFVATPQVVRADLKARCCMADTAGKPARGWQEIAADAAKESNRDKLQQLSEELDRALVERREYLQRLEKEKNTPGEKTA